MRKISLLLVLCLGIMAKAALAADVEVKLDSSNGSSGMVIKDSGGTAVATVDSDGNIKAASIIESKSGGFKFPNGTTQTIAFSSGNYVLRAGDTMTGSLTIAASAVNLNIGEELISDPRGPIGIMLTGDGKDIFLETYSGDMSEGLIMRGGDADSGIVKQVAGNGYTNGWPLGLHIFTKDTNPIILKTDNTERMRISGAGNVGIGTTDATSKLTVVGTIEMKSGSGGGIKFPDATIQTSAANTGNYVLKAGDTMTGTLTNSATTGLNISGKVIIGTPGVSKTLSVYGQSRFEAGQEDNEQFVIFESAAGYNALNFDNNNKYFLFDQTNLLGINVGIGVSNPTARLQAISTGTTASFETSGSSGTAVYGLASATTGANYGGYFTSAGDTGQAVYGLASATTNYINYGGYFEAGGKYGYGVYGNATHAGSGNYGVYGTASDGRGVSGNSVSNIGVEGIATGTGAVGNWGGRFTAAGDTGQAVYGLASATSGVNYGGYFETNSASGFGVYSDGQFGANNKVWFLGLSAAGAGTTLVLTGGNEVITLSSSLRYKHDIRDYEADPSKINDLKPVRFRWNENTATPNAEDFGLIAEDVYAVFPELVSLNKNGSPESVHYEKIAVVLLKDYQEKTKEINALKARNQEIEARLKAVEEKMGK